MVYVRIPAAAVIELKPAPLSLIDGSPTGGHALVMCRGGTPRRPVLVSVDASTAQRAVRARTIQARGLSLIGVAGGPLIGGFLVGSVLFTGGHRGVGAVVLGAGVVVALALVAAGLRMLRRAGRLRGQIPLGAELDPDGDVILGPVHPDAAQEWARVNRPGFVTIVR
ncbi:hypothetical protein GCM10023322_25940 [Rugosimonospora acidiphila]|uniref:Uncharacterized protein n=1 Tax=Rugosimonospora acidiphila TaxID=556531 RepID=A0ABP9RQE3_9ACTN